MSTRRKRGPTRTWHHIAIDARPEQLPSLETTLLRRAAACGVTIDRVGYVRESLQALARGPREAVAAVTESSYPFVRRHGREVRQKCGRAYVSESLIASGYKDAVRSTLADPGIGECETVVEAMELRLGRRSIPRSTMRVIESESENDLRARLVAGAECAVRLGVGVLLIDPCSIRESTFGACPELFFDIDDRVVVEETLLPSVVHDALMLSLGHITRRHSHMWTYVRARDQIDLLKGHLWKLDSSTEYEMHALITLRRAATIARKGPWWKRARPPLQAGPP